MSFRFLLGAGAMGFMSLDGTGVVELAFIGRVFYFRVIPASLFL